MARAIQGSNSIEGFDATMDPGNLETGCGQLVPSMIKICCRP